MQQLDVHDTLSPSTSDSPDSHADTSFTSATGSSFNNEFNELSDVNLVQETVEKCKLQMFSKLYSNKSVTRSYIQTVVSEVSEFIGNAVSCVRDVIQSKMTGVSALACDSVNRCLDT